MENLDEQQRNSILRKRQEMFQKMGVSNAGKMMNESIVATNSASAGMASKLAAIRSGAAKAELSQYINATNKQGGPNGGFQGIPEPKAKKNQQEVKDEFKQKVVSFDAPSNGDGGELSAIEAMFGGSDGGSRMTTQHHQGSNMQQAPIPELSIDSLNMPSFNPQAMSQAKIRNQTQAQSQYLKYASESAAQNEQFVEMGNAVSSQVNPAQLQMMMETIARGVAEKTIRNVLSEYAEQQKGKVYFEYYNKEKSVIKTPDGKFYRLTQVELKKKA